MRNLKKILSPIQKPIKSVLRHIDIEADDLSEAELVLATKVAELLLAIEEVVDEVLPPRQQKAKSAPRREVRFVADEDVVRLEFPEPKKPRKRPAKVKAKVKANKDDSPMGTYGEWDYNNADWTKVPTVSDIPEIMAQKQQRYPKNNLWQSEELMVDWFKTKGWIPQNPQEST